MTRKSKTPEEAERLYQERKRQKEAESEHLDRIVKAAALRIKFAYRDFSEPTIDRLVGAGIKLPEELLAMREKDLKVLKEKVGSAAMLEIEDYRKRFRRKPVEVGGYWPAPGFVDTHLR